MTDNYLIILAAGKGTRMRSNLPKVLHELAGFPMLGHVIDNGLGAGFTHICLVTAPDQDEVREMAQHHYPNIMHAIQKQALGTGDAVRAALNMVPEESLVTVVFGDTPLLHSGVLTKMMQTPSDLLVLGFVPHDPARFGRIQTEKGHPTAIVEFKDADEKTREIRLCNGGAMTLKGTILHKYLPKLKSNNAQGEYYLTDLVAMAHADGCRIGLLEGLPEDVLGVDHQEALAQAEKIIQNRLRQKHLQNGVQMEDPSSVFFRYDTQIEAGASLEPNIYFGKGVTVEADVKIRAFSHIEGATIRSGAQIGPFARLREGTDVGSGGKIGNFVETKKAKLATGVKVNHLSYIGDAEIGEHANIGAGTITCNYDGFNKHVTRIGAGAFIGSNSSLIAPVTIGAGAYLGSGTAISGEVAADDLAVTRGERRIVAGWARKFRAKNQKK